MNTRIGRGLLIGAALAITTLAAGCYATDGYGYGYGPSYGAGYSYYGSGYVYAPRSNYYAPKRYYRDRDGNPPGPRGGPGTNWENPPGPRGGPGASPDRRRTWRYR